MTDELPADLRASIERIEVAPSPQPSDPRAGALGRLAAWWAAVAPAPAEPPVPAALEPPDADPDGSGREPRDAPGAPDDAGVRTALAAGVLAADRAIDAGATLLVVGPRPPQDLPARAVVALLARREASAVLPQPAGMTDREWMARCAQVRDLAAAGQAHRGDPVALLAATGAGSLAATVGALLAAAARRTPCLLDGTAPLAAALVADRLAYRARGWWLAASDSSDPGRTAAIDRIDLAVALPLGLADDDGLGARAVLALLPLR